MTNFSSQSRLIALTLILFLCACGGGSGVSRTDDAVPAESACAEVGLNNRIINGTACASPERSAVVRVILQSAAGLGICSGTAITSNAVLTAAHCLEGLNPTGISFGTFDPNDLVDISEVFIHPDYEPTTGNFDAAVIITGRDLRIPTLALLGSRQVSRRELVSIFGYGTTDGTNNQNEDSSLRSGQMVLSRVTDLMISAEFSGVGSNTCFGDSGGPLLAKADNGSSAIAGLTSFGQRSDCSAGDTSVFTNIQNQSITDFILSVAPNTAIE